MTSPVSLKSILPVRNNFISAIRKFSNQKIVTPVLHVNASPSPDSLVSQTSHGLISQFQFGHQLRQRNLWSDELISYNMSHVAAKMRLMKGRGSKDDEDLFQPIEEMAHELNHCRLLIISSPIWNFSFPYVLKQYIDIALQPGVNFHEEPEEQPVTGSKTLVVVSSSGGHYGVGSREHMNSYLSDVFDMVGYENKFFIKIEGAARSSRDDLMQNAKLRSEEVANQVNNIFKQ